MQPDVKIPFFAGKSYKPDFTVFLRIEILSDQDHFFGTLFHIKKTTDYSL
jgi:restriction endonuclease